MSDPIAGVINVLHLLGDALPRKVNRQLAMTGKLSDSDRLVKRPNAREPLLTAQKKAIRTTGTFNFPFRHFTLLYRRENAGTQGAYIWTLAFHGINHEEEAETLEGIKEYLSIRGIRLVPVDGEGERYGMVFPDALKE